MTPQMPSKSLRFFSLAFGIQIIQLVNCVPVHAGCRAQIKIVGVWSGTNEILCLQGDEVEDLPGEHVSEEQFMDEHGNIVTKKVGHVTPLLNCPQSRHILHAMIINMIIIFKFITTRICISTPPPFRCCPATLPP